MEFLHRVDPSSAQPHNSLETRPGGRKSVSSASRTTFPGTGAQRAVSPGGGLKQQAEAYADLCLITCLPPPCITPSSKC